jgi:hypothetical protein
MIIAVTILAIDVIKETLEELVILAEITSETEIVTAEVDTQIAIHVLAHIRALVEDLVTNALITLDRVLLVPAPILELQIMVLLFLETLKFLCFENYFPPNFCTYQLKYEK